jgi:glycosyltransferase involved in cell wall biosynthesis
MVLLRRKVVVTLHDIEPLAERAGASSPLVRRCAEALIDAWIVHNELCREMLAHRLGIDPSEIAVIPHGNYPCDSQPLPTRAEARALLSLPSGGPIVLFFGHIKAVKGLDLLIEATARLRRSGTRIHVVIAGKTWKEEFEPYQAQIDRLQLHDQFTVRIEYIPTEDVPLYFAAADLVALPYREVYQSGVALMAMSYGLPVVASDLDGMRETIEDGRTGHLFRRCSAADLARTIDAALLHPERLGTIASNALREVAIERDWAVIGERTREVYERVLGQEKPLEPPPQPGRRGATTRQLRRRLLMLMATVGCVFWLGHEGGAAVGSTAATSIPEPAFASLAALGLVGLIALGIHGCRADQKEVV